MKHKTASRADRVQMYVSMYIVYVCMYIVYVCMYIHRVRVHVHCTLKVLGTPEADLDSTEFLQKCVAHVLIYIL